MNIISKNYKYLICVFGIILFLQGTVATGEICNTCVAEPFDDANGVTHCGCLNEDFIYNYDTNMCTVEEAAYGTTSFCGRNSELYNETECICSDGWELNEKTNVCDEPIETMCSTLTDPCDSKEFCFDTPGIGKGYVCTCNIDQYREIEGARCYGLDEGKNPQWNNCTQDVTELGVGFECKCFSDCYELDEDGVTCNLVTGCTVIEDEVDHLCVKKGSAAQQCYAKQGFEKLENDVYADIDECLDEKYPCFAHSTCVNLDGGQGYECLCDAGFTNYNGNLPRECVRTTCGRGSGCSCLEDPCKSDTSSELCQSTSPTTVEYRIHHKDMIGDLDISKASVYFFEIKTKNGPFHTSDVTKSIDFLLGSGVSQVTTTDSKDFNVSILQNTMRLKNLSGSNITQLIHDGCMDASLPETECYLPYGVIVERASMSSNEEDFCDSAPCDNDHKCVSEGGGKYKCVCKKSGTKTYLKNVEQCTLTSDLKYYEDVTIGLSVTLGLVCILMIGLVLKQFKVHKKIFV